MIDVEKITDGKRGAISVRWGVMLGRHRVALTCVLVVMGIVGSWLSRGVRWEADILAFFSGESADVRAMRAAGESAGITGQLRLDVHGADGEEVRRAAGELAERLRASGQFRMVWSGVSETEMAARYARLAGGAGQGAALLDEAAQRAIEENATAEKLTARMAEAKTRLVDPDGEIVLRRLMADPLGVSDAIGTRLAAISPVRNEAATIERGMLTARDADGGVHVMLVGEPAVGASVGGVAAKIMAATDGAIAVLRVKYPVEVWVVGAHRGYVENERRVKRDVTVISTVGTMLVAGAIALYFGWGAARGARLRGGILAAGVCLIPPFVGVGLAMGIAGVLGAHLPLILLGFAGLLCGSTTDYGIQMIAACRRIAAREGGWTEDVSGRAAREMFGPITMSVATSVTGFAALGLSESPGLRALGLFVAGATVCIWAVTFLVLPAYLGLLRDVQVAAPVATMRRVGWMRVGWLMGLGAFGVVTLAMMISAGRIRFNTDARALDGSSAAARAEEESFYRVWGDLRNRAVVLVHGANAEAALDELQRVDGYLRTEKAEGLLAGIVSPAAILPDGATAARNVAAWNGYWTEARKAELARVLETAGRAQGFRADAFAGAVGRLTETAVAPAEARVGDSPAALFPGLIEARAEGVTVAVVVEMNAVKSGAAAEGVSPRMAGAWAGELRMRFPNVSILSGNLLVFDATERARAEGERLAPWCALAIIVPLLVYFRRLRRAWLVMTCLAVGFVWVLGVAQGAGGGLNLLSLVPVLFTLGVAVDYGIYAATGRSAAGRGAEGSRNGATFLCALTTILGSGSLVLAGHPALRWLGMTLVAGVTGGYLASVYVVGPLAGFLDRPVRFRIAAGIGRWFVRAGLAGLTVIVAIPVVVEVVLQHQKPAGLEAPRAHAAVEQVGARAWRAGENWMRWRAAPADANSVNRDAGLWEIRLAGDAQERGYATAKLSGPIDYRIENEMLDQLDYFLPGEWARWLVLRGVATNLANLPAYVAPEYQQEIYWAAAYHEDGHRYLAPTYPRILSYHALHDISQMLIDNPLIVPNTFACTGVISLPEFSGSGGHLLLARNFDFEGGESFGRQKSVTFVIPPAGEGIPFAHVAWPGLSGAVTGMNREKIAVFVNAAATRDFRRIGTPTIFMARDILQHARSIDEAEAIVRRTAVFVSDIVVVADGKTGRARVFEKSPGATAAYDVDASAVVANHLVTPTFVEDPVNKEREAEGTTGQRYARARQLLDRMRGAVTPEKLAELLRDKRGVDDVSLGMGNRNAIDGLIACHAVVMDVTAGKMWVAAWPNAEGAFVEVDVLGMLGEAGRDGENLAESAPILMGEDSMMVRHAGETESGWERWVASRKAAAEAAALLHGTTLDRETINRVEALAEEVVRDNPDFYLGHELLGHALWLHGDRAGAKAQWLEALRLDPPYAQRRKEIEGLIRTCETAAESKR